MRDKFDLAFDCGRNNPLSYSHRIKRITAPIAAKEIVGKKNILVITGSGVSAASGIPPFKGDSQGFWARKQYEGLKEP